ncbi:adrenomedullin 2 [Rattus norvegicus]|uniref:Adrenomedullin 2 n=1 Tax=Rattus norvegicus TaxID=10116 RepID=A6K7L3_RAT|nr:adrenomedullin 2 [Rattus norvegicus]
MAQLLMVTVTFGCISLLYLLPGTLSGSLGKGLRPRVVAHDTQVPSVTWDPEDPMPSSFGLAVSWERVKSRISAIACGNLSGQVAGGTQLLWIPAAPTVMAEVGPRYPA